MDAVIYQRAHPRFLARIITGNVPESLGLGPWPETNTVGLNGIKQQVWPEAKERARVQHISVDDTSTKILGAAARKVGYNY